MTRHKTIIGVATLLAVVLVVGWVIGNDGDEVSDPTPPKADVPERHEPVIGQQPEVGSRSIDPTRTLSPSDEVFQSPPPELEAQSNQEPPPVGYRLVVPINWTVEGQKLGGDAEGQPDNGVVQDIIDGKLLKPLARLRIVVDTREEFITLPWERFFYSRQDDLSVVRYGDQEGDSVAILKLLDDSWDQVAPDPESRLNWWLELDSIRVPDTADRTGTKYQRRWSELSQPRFSYLRSRSGESWRTLEFDPITIETVPQADRVIAVGRFYRKLDGVGVKLVDARLPKSGTDAWKFMELATVHSYECGKFWFEFDAKLARNPIELLIYPGPQDPASNSGTRLSLTDPVARGRVLDYGDIEYPFGTVDVVCDPAPSVWQQGWPDSEADFWLKFRTEQSEWGFYHLVQSERVVLGLGTEAMTVSAGLYGINDSLFPLTATQIAPVTANPRQVQTVYVSPTWTALRPLTVLEDGEVAHRGFWQVTHTHDVDSDNKRNALEYRTLRTGFENERPRIKAEDFPAFLPALPMGARQQTLTLFTRHFEAATFDLVPGESGPVTITLNKRTRVVCYRVATEPLTDRLIERLVAIGIEPSDFRYYVHIGPAGGGSGGGTSVIPGETAEVLLESDSGGSVRWNVSCIIENRPRSVVSLFSRIASDAVALSVVESLAQDSDGSPIVQLPPVIAPDEVFPREHFFVSRSDSIPTVFQLGSWRAYVRGTDEFGNDITSTSNLPSKVKDGNAIYPVRYQPASDLVSTTVQVELPARLEVTITGGAEAGRTLAGSVSLNNRGALSKVALGRLGSSTASALNIPTRLWAEPGEAVLTVYFTDADGNSHWHSVPITLEQGRLKFLTIDLDKIVVQKPQ